MPAPIIVFMTGCAFLKYETKEQALAALEAINGKHKMEVCVQDCLILVISEVMMLVGSQLDDL